jgi:2-succinyl-6-hydroxy-2,4-cyclohexadiene-1-carboxylate synthase
VLILLHGFAHTPASWREVQAALPASIGARAALTPGHDPALAVGASWDETIDRLAAHLGPVSDTIVVGYSLGARLALGLLARDAIAGAILIGLNPGSAAGDDDARAGRRAADAAWSARLRRDGTAAFLAAWEQQPTFTTPARAPAEVRARRHAERARLEPGALAAALDVLGLGVMPDLAPALTARAARAHLVVGADDAKFVALARTLAHQAPDLVIDVVDGSGHDPTLEAPAVLAATIARAAARLAR